MQTPETIAPAPESLDATPPAYLINTLGHPPPPSRSAHCHAWQTAATVIQEYRDRWNVHHPTAPLGPLPTDPAQQLAHEQAAAILRQAQQDLNAGAQQLHLDLAL